MREFTAKSYAEKRLERAHADDEDRVTPEDVHESSVEASEALAQLIADHPHIGLSAREILAFCEYRHDELRDSAAELYPDHFDGGEAGA